MDCEKNRIFWRGGDDIPYENRNRILQYGVYLFHESINVIEDKEILDEIIGYARNESIHEYVYNEVNDSNTETIKNDNLYLAVRIYFEECENIVWDAVIKKHDDVYCIQRFYYEPSDIYKATYHYPYDYYLLSDDVSEMIDGLLNNNE